MHKNFQTSVLTLLHSNMGSTSEDFPEELTDTVKNFHGSVTDLKAQLDLLLETPKEELCGELDPLERAKVDLISVYAINSIFWMLLKTQGENPAEAGVKKELDRVKEAMMRCKEIQDKAKRGRVDQGAAKRLVTSGLWKPGEEKIREKRPVAGDGTEEGVDEEAAEMSAGSFKKKKIGQFDV